MGGRDLIKKFMLFITATIGLLSADIAYSCPAFVTASNFPEWIYKTPLKNLRMYAVTPTNTWKSIPLQIDPMTDKNLYDSDRPLASGQDTVRPTDRFVFATDEFGQALNQSIQFPCDASKLTEISSPTKTFGYLADCSGASDDVTNAQVGSIRLNTSDRKISSPRFDYIYHPKNQLLYESLFAKFPGGKIVRSAYDADIGLRLDLKNFFTLHFHNGDIESYINSSKVGEVGVVQGIAFYLRLFAFKIDLKMNTVASFFENSANIPMLVDVPRNAYEHLNPGSGSLYSFKLDKASFEMDHPTSNMPKLEAELVKKGSPLVKESGLRQCKGDQCNFKMMGKVENEPFALSMNLPKNVVEMGFFPTFVADTKEFKSGLGWKGAEKSAPNEVGIFFPTNGLSKGQYKIDSWILLGDESLKTSSCPADATIGPTVTPDSKRATAH